VKSPRTSRSLVALALAGALVVTACGGDDDDTASGPTTADATVTVADDPGATAATAGPGATTAETQTTEVDAASLDDLDRSATLRFAYGISVSRLDPHRATIRNDLTTLGPAYDRLVEFNPQGELVPMLATEWSFNEDATVLEMTLREGVVFHDGEPFDAEAVKANIERAKTLEGSTVAADLVGVSGVEVVDDHHVRVLLTEPDVSILGILSDRAGMIVSPAAFDEDLEAVAVGAGPFRLVEYRPGDVTVFERFDDYWDPDVALVQRLEIHVVPDANTRLNGLRGGQFDLINPTAAQYEEAASLPGFTVRTDPGLFAINMGLNRTRSEFGDVLVRRAIYHAIDRDSICQAVLQGQCEVSVQPFPQGYWAANPDIPSDRYAYDPAKAKELLAEAGLPDGFSFTFMIPAALPPYDAIGEVIQGQLADVGIRADLVLMEPAQMADRYYVAKETDAILGGLVGSADPSLYFGQYTMPDAYANVSGDSTETMQRLYHESIATSDEAERTRIIHEGVEEVVDQVFFINIAFTKLITAGRENVVGFVMPVSGNPQFRGVGMTAG
jgi:peptide/nickel transport system substrate-binding protein